MGHCRANGYKIAQPILPDFKTVGSVLVVVYNFT